MLHTTAPCCLSIASEHTHILQLKEYPTTIRESQSSMNHQPYAYLPLCVIAIVKCHLSVHQPSSLTRVQFLAGITVIITILMGQITGCQLQSTLSPCSPPHLRCQSESSPQPQLQGKEKAHSITCAPQQCGPRMLITAGPAMPAVGVTCCTSCTLDSEQGHAGI